MLSSNHTRKLVSTPVWHGLLSEIEDKEQRRHMELQNRKDCCGAKMEQLSAFARVRLVGDVKRERKCPP